jgi:hypothetical protein
VTGISGPILWHKPTIHITSTERRELYEARLALDWCRTNGNPHLETR